jgi:hypothetical protein
MGQGLRSAGLLVSLIFGSLVLWSQPALSEPATEPPSKRVFLSSALYYGNLGGLAGADAQCQTLAKNVGLPGTFKAWLSDAKTSAHARLTHATIPYTLVAPASSPGPIVAKNWNDFTVGMLHTAITQTETGRSVSSAPYVWTNTKADGTLASPNLSFTCQDWTMTASSIDGGVGFSQHTEAPWTQHSSQNCALTARLYCVEQ